MFGWLNFNRPIHSALVCTIPPATEPVTLAQAKAQCRVEITDDDVLIGALITAGRRYAEVAQRRALITSTWVYSLDNFPIFGSSAFVAGEIRLPIPPVQSVSSVQYYDIGGNLNTLDPSRYIVDVASQPARIISTYATPWPVVTWTRPSSVMITFVAGYANAAAVPVVTQQAILLWVAWMYAQRGDSEALQAPPAAIDALLSIDSFGGQIV